MFRCVKSGNDGVITQCIELIEGVVAVQYIVLTKIITATQGKTLSRHPIGSIGRYPISLNRSGQAGRLLKLGIHSNVVANKILVKAVVIGGVNIQLVKESIAVAGFKSPHLFWPNGSNIEVVQHGFIPSIEVFP